MKTSEGFGFTAGEGLVNRFTDQVSSQTRNVEALARLSGPVRHDQRIIKNTPGRP